MVPAICPKAEQIGNEIIHYRVSGRNKNKFFISERTLVERNLRFLIVQFLERLTSFSRQCEHQKVVRGS